MDGIFYDRVCETSTTTGTGDFTLDGAITGFQTFFDAGVQTGAKTPYLIEAVDANGTPTGEWETGIGARSGPSTLQRVAVTGSSDAASLVDFSAGTKRVHLAATAARLGAVGGCYRRSADLTGQNLTTAAAIPWNTVDWENDPTFAHFHESVTNPSRITVPAGYDGALVRLSGQIALSGITVGDYVELSLRMNTSTIVARSTAYIPTTTPSLLIESNIFFATLADYYELFVKVGADTSVDISHDESRFQLQVIQ